MSENDKGADCTAVEVVEASALAVISKAEIDVQISTAHQYPRSMQVFKRRAMEMVTLDEETAASCIYRRPVGKKPGGAVEYAEGMSVRMAEIVGACYGNLRVGAQLIAQTPRQVTARGFAHDLESNFASTSEVVEATVKANGSAFSERMAVVVAKAAVAKARRDATFQVVPRALCKALEAAARKTAIGTEKTLGARRTLVTDWINKLSVEPARVWAAIGVAGIEDVGLNELETLMGIRTAIKDGDTTAEEAFPKLGGAAGALPPMPGKVATEQQSPPPDESGRTVDDEINELGESLGKTQIETAALIKQHAKKGTLDSLRDQFRLEFKRRQAEG